MKTHEKTLQMDVYALKYQNINRKDTCQNNDNSGLGMKGDAGDCKEVLYICSISREAVMDHD